MNIEAPVVTVVRPELFNDKHAFDAELVAEAFEMSIATVAAAIGKPTDTIGRRKSAESLQDGRGQLGLIYSDLYALHAGDRDAVLRWLNTPNRALKERARPRVLLERWQLSVLEALDLEFDKAAATWFFQLLCQRYERRSTIITSNKSLSQWGDIFSDTTLAAALLDRFLHHSHVLSFKGESYRLRGKTRGTPAPPRKPPVQEGPP